MQYVAAFRTRTGDRVCMGRFLGTRDPDLIKQKTGRLAILGPPVLTFKAGVYVMSTHYKWVLKTVSS